jgi:hypothetical protein
LNTLPGWRRAWLQRSNWDAVVAPADQHEQLAGLRPDRDQTTLELPPRIAARELRSPLLDLAQPVLERRRGDLLQSPVQRRVDAQPLLGELLGRVGLDELPVQEVEEEARVAGLRGDGRKLQRLVARLRSASASMRPCCAISSSTRLRRLSARSGSRTARSRSGSG